MAFDPSRPRSPWRALFLLALGPGLTACAEELRRFPIQSPMWTDDDQRPFSPMPEAYYSGLVWDGADQTFFAPVSRYLRIEIPGEATNVNALDEVPDSSWFQNRIGTGQLSMESFTEGPCAGHAPLDPAGPWTVVAAKPNGANPGFVIKDAEGRRFLLKFDGLKQPERATSADVIGTYLYHAAGYHTPCNSVVFFDPSILSVAPNATSDTGGGKKEPLTVATISEVVAKGTPVGDGRVRASASLFLSGRPLGPWTYQGMRDDDPNDVVPHEDRRELRGSYVMAALLNHFDAREQNTLSMWIADDSGKGYVRHNLIDFGDCLGSLWELDALARRLGHSNYFDFYDVTLDFISFGLRNVPWDRARFGVSGPVFGYYDDALFDPKAWQPGYPNPAMARRTERDAAWGARILARLTDWHLHLAVRKARIASKALSRELERILRGRRDRLLARYLGRLSPLTRPTIQQENGTSHLCLEDLGLYAGLVAPEDRTYRVRVHGDGIGTTEAQGPGRARADGWACVPVPAMGGSRIEPAYLMVDVAAGSKSSGTMAAPVRVHLAGLGDSSLAVVGLERPDDATPTSP